MSKTEKKTAKERLTILKRNVKATKFTVSEALPHLGITLHAALHSIQRESLAARQAKKDAKGRAPKGYVITRAALIDYMERQVEREAAKAAA